MKESMITKSSIVEIQNLVVNPKLWPVRSNSEQYQFLFKYISPATAGVPQHLNVKDTERIGNQTKNYSFTINIQEQFNQFAQLIKSIVRYTWLKSPMIYKVSPIFDYAHPIIIKVTINFPKFVAACKKISLFHQFILEIEQILEPQGRKGHVHFPSPPPKKLLAFMSFYQHTKNQFIQLIPFWDTANFRVLRPEWSYPFLTTPTPTFFDQLLIFMNLYQHAKNQTFSSFCSRDTVNLKILQSDWPRSF